MNTSAATATTIAQSDIDRLVDGELDDAARASLVRALDRSPDGWKRCAAAFLEAQAWTQAARSIAPVAASPVRPGHLGARPILRQLLTIAAVVAVAFCAGFVSRSAGPIERLAQRDGQVVHEARPAPAARPRQVAVADVSGASAVPEYVRSQMERQGYRVEGGRKVIELALEDGRRVTVPVDTVSYRYVGQRIH
jgi:hypothetical protein